MKKFIFPFAFLFAMALAFRGQAQCDCFYMTADPDPNTCCVNLYLGLYNDPNCNNYNYNSVTLTMIGSTPPLITGATAAPMFTVVQTGTQVTFTSSFNLTTIGTSTTQAIGTVCFEATSTIVAYDVTIDGPLPAPNGCTIPHGGFDSPCIPPPPTYGEWAQVCGDSARNEPTKIKAYDGFVYVAGTRTINGVRRATFTKYDGATGAEVWARTLSAGSIIHDFVRTVENDGFMVVGATEPFQIGGVQQDNQSLLYRIFDNGTLTLNRRYQQNGREHFNRIIAHPNPVNSNFPYYIVGTKNPTATASAADIVTLFNTNSAGATGFYREYNYTTEEGEFHRGLFPLDNGNVVLTGNNTFANDGMIVEVNGATGNIVKAIKYPAGLDVYDGMELPNGDIAIVGADFGQSKAFIALLKPNYNLVQAQHVSPLLDFREIGRDNAGRLYALGTWTGPTKRNVMCRFSVINGIGLNFNYARWLNDGEDLYLQGRFSVTPAADNIFYADGRIDYTPPPPGFGNFDQMVGSFDLELSSDCEETQVVDTATFSFTRVDITPEILNVTATLPLPTTLGGGVLDYDCRPFCAPLDTCTANFEWQPDGDCFVVQFTALPTGTGPFTYSWDIGCNGSVEYTTANPAHDFTMAGTYDVCLTITSSTGCMATYSDVVVVTPDMTAPVLSCPTGVIVRPTDPGHCYATYSPPITLVDDCDIAPTLMCVLSGATIGTNTSTQYNKGLTHVMCTGTDHSGNTATCMFDVLVEDHELPVIVCPQSPSTTIPVCQGSAQMSFGPPTVTDNCPMVTYTCNHQSGEFFPCGQTIVICTATDMSGNTAQCNFGVNVYCECASITGSSIECGAVHDTYDFTLTVENLTGSTGSSDCSITLGNPQGGIAITSYNVVWGGGSGNTATVSGLISVPMTIPNSLQFDLTLSCICSDGHPVSCTQPVSLTPPCCDSVYVDPRAICSETDTIYVPLRGCTALADVQQVRWYITPAPCPAAPWGGTPYQTTTGCADLVMLPYLYNTDVCVYAEVTVGMGDYPCTVITSNIQTISICPPLACTIDPAQQEFCYMGVPIVPDPFQINTADAHCDYTVQWYDGSGNLLNGETGDAYQPGPVDFGGAPDDCFFDTGFRVSITDLCGTRDCDASVRLWNDDAPKGTLTIDPVKTEYCPGEDAMLHFEPGCAGVPPLWKWYSGSDASGPTYSFLPGAGTFNPDYNTNKFYEDFWFMVETKNGVCPEDTVQIFVNVKDELKAGDFSATLLPDSCAPSQLLLSLDFSPCNTPAECNCYTIEWYKDGFLLGSGIYNSTPATFLYDDPLLGGDYSGNYAAVIIDNCCNRSVETEIITVKPPCKLILAGPCFRCCNETVQLDAIIVNPMPGVTCTYNWYVVDNGATIPLGNDDFLIYDGAGTVFVEVSCGGCMKTESFFIKQCIPDSCVLGTAAAEASLLRLDLRPNPTTGFLNVEWKNELSVDGPFELRITNLQDRLIYSEQIPRGVNQTGLQLDQLPAGAYILRLLDERGRGGQRLFVKQ